MAIQFSLQACAVWSAPSSVCDVSGPTRGCALVVPNNNRLHLFPNSRLASVGVVRRTDFALCNMLAGRSVEAKYRVRRSNTVNGGTRGQVRAPDCGRSCFHIWSRSRQWPCHRRPFVVGLAQPSCIPVEPAAQPPSRRLPCEDLPVDHDLNSQDTFGGDDMENPHAERQNVLIQRIIKNAVCPGIF